MLAQFNQYLQVENEKAKIEQEKNKTSEVGKQIVDIFSGLGDNPTMEQINNATKASIGLAYQNNTPNALAVLEPLMKVSTQGYSEGENKLMSKFMQNEYKDILGGIDLNEMSGATALQAIQQRLSGIKTVQTKEGLNSTSKMITYDSRNNKVLSQIDLGGMTKAEEMKIENAEWDRRDNKNFAQQVALRMGTASSSQPKMIGTLGDEPIFQVGTQMAVYKNGQLTPYAGDLKGLDKFQVDANPLVEQLRQMNVDKKLNSQADYELKETARGTMASMMGLLDEEQSVALSGDKTFQGMDEYQKIVYLQNKYGLLDKARKEGLVADSDVTTLREKAYKAGRTGQSSKKAGVFNPLTGKVE